MTNIESQALLTRLRELGVYDVAALPFIVACRKLPDHVRISLEYVAPIYQEED